MKKLLLLSAVLIGVASASQAQAGVHVQFGFPLPPLPHVSIRAPSCPPVVVSAPSCAPPVYYYQPGYYGQRYSQHRCYPGCGHGHDRHAYYSRGHQDHYGHGNHRDGHGNRRDGHGRW